MTVCRQCGAPTRLVCACGTPMCDAHSFTYIDESNVAISRSSRPQCWVCVPPTYPRPYSLVRALERGEWWLS